jgi:hypothetical protein
MANELQGEREVDELIRRIESLARDDHRKLFHTLGRRIKQRGFDNGDHRWLDVVEALGDLVTVPPPPRSEPERRIRRMISDAERSGKSPGTQQDKPTVPLKQVIDELFGSNGAA